MALFRYICSMKIKKADELFHGEERYNCAQAVIKAFEGEFKVTKGQILLAAKKGGGRADEGLCGALYAAHLLVSDDEMKQEPVSYTHLRAHET